jgi:hypothetical protein
METLMSERLVRAEDCLANEVGLRGKQKLERRAARIYISVPSPSAMIKPRHSQRKVDVVCAHRVI